MHGYFSSESVGELITGILPNISGTFAVGQAEYQRIPFTKVSGCFTSGTGSTIYTHDIDGGWNGGRYDGVKFSASRSSSVYKDNVEGVIPRSIIMRYMIKYI